MSVFAREGIPPARVCLKIPATGAGMSAAAELEAGPDGVTTLATTLFGVVQARAAAQAGCTYVAPYFNELAVHFEDGVWVGYADVEGVLREHKGVEVVRGVVGLYRWLEAEGEAKAGKMVVVQDGGVVADIHVPALAHAQSGGEADAEGTRAPRARRHVPYVMPASIVDGREALALSTLGVDRMTLSTRVLEDLANGVDAVEERGEGEEGAQGQDADGEYRVTESITVSAGHRVHLHICHGRVVPGHACRE
jgi:transaldolase